MEPQVKPNLFSVILTTQDLELFYKELDQIKVGFFKEGNNPESLLEGILSENKKKLLIDFMTNEKLNWQNPTDFGLAVKKIKEIGDGLPIVKLTLAIDPSAKTIKNIRSWFEGNINGNFLLKFSTDTRLVGGAYITSGGLFKDYTLKAAIDQLFQKKNYGKL